jgi:hypothetical protein
MQESRDEKLLDSLLPKLARAKYIHFDSQVFLFSPKTNQHVMPIFSPEK